MLMLGIRSFTVLKRDEASDSGSCSQQMDVLLGKVRVLVLILSSRLAHALRPLRQWVCAAVLVNVKRYWHRER